MKSNRTHHSRMSMALSLAMILAMALNFLPGIVPGTQAPTAEAHNLQTRMVSMFLDAATQKMLDDRMADPGWSPPDPLLQAGDELGLIIKVVPRDGTTTGVGGHIDFYVPGGVDVVDVGYVVPDGAGGFVKVAMKGQSPIAIGAGPIGAKTTSQLIGLTDIYASTASGLSSTAVNPTTGLHLGTIAGLYGDTGIFYSTDPDTAYGSWQQYTGDWNANPSLNKCGSLAFTAANGKTLVNNSGDTVVPCNKWDAEQLMAWGVKGGTFGQAAPIVDYADGRGNAPWGFASGVAGPQSGYAWHFDWDQWQASGKTAADMRAAMANTKIGPWQRIKYPGSRISYDQPGLVSSVLGYANIDASNVGYAVSPSNPLPPNTKAIRWAVGQLTAYRNEYAWVKIRVNSIAEITDPSGCPLFKGDTFGGDAGGTDNGKDHLWRYYEPTEATWNGCLAAQKTATREIVKVGDTYQYKLKVYNFQNFTLSSVVVRDPLPSGVTFIGAVPAQNSGPNPLVWNVGTLLPGQKWEATVTVKAASTGFIDNCINIDSAQLPTQTVCDTTEVGNYVYLVPTKEATPLSVPPGGTVEYTILVKNIGTGPTGSPVIVRDFLPPGMIYNNAFTPVVHVNGAQVTTFAVDVSNPNNPVITVPVAINGSSQMTIKFQALVPLTLAPGTYCNTYSVTQNGIPITSGSEGCVQVAGGQIGDTIFRDWNGNGSQETGEEGMPGVTVNLYAGTCPPSGSPIQTRTTDASGKYLFTGLTAGTYCVQAPAPGSGGVPSGYTLTADPDGSPYTTTHQKTLGQDEVYLGADWGYQPGGTGAIGDQVFDDLNNNGLFDAGDVGMAGITVDLYEDTNGNGVVDPGDLLIKTTATNGLGVYQFTGLATGLSYIVDVRDIDITNYYATTGWVATTTDPHPVPNLAGVYSDADFGYYKIIPGRIGDEVFLDNNGNGVYDAGDQYLPQVTVYLYRDANGNGLADPTELVGTAVTDANGRYLFEDLPPGNYIVIVDTADPDLPAGTVPTESQYKVALGAAEQYLTADFPFVPLIAKTVDKSYAQPGDTLNFTVRVNYPGDRLLDNVKVIDPLPLGTTCGTVGQGGSCAAYISTPGTPGVVAVDTSGAAVYSNNSATPQYRLWSGSDFDDETASVALGNIPRILIGAAAPTRDEKIVVNFASNNGMYGARWDGEAAAWTALPQPPATGAAGLLATATTGPNWGAAVAYEQVSGDAVLVWNNGTTGSTGLTYNVWNGTSWGTNATITTPLSGEPRQMRLAARPNSDQMVLVVSNASGYDYALVWSGSAWGNAVTLDGTSGGSLTSVHVAYEQQSGKAMVVYGKALTDTRLYYRTWDGASWSGELSIDPSGLGVTTGPQWVSLAADPTSNRLAVGVVTSGARTWLAVWNGSTWAAPILATGASLTSTALNVGVAFETQSGRLLAAYGVSASTVVQYRTWTSGGGWSGQLAGPNIGANPNVIALSRSPNSNRIMLTTNDADSDANYTLWDGGAWGAPFEANINTGTPVNQPAIFLYDQHVDPTSSTTLSASPTTVANGGTVTVQMTLLSTKTVPQVSPSPLTAHNGSAACVGPAEAVPTTVFAAVPKTFTWTCTPNSLGEIWFTGYANSPTYDFADGASNTVLVSTDGSSTVVTWNLGSTAPDVPGTVSSAGTSSKIYAFQGGTQAFWSYDVIANSWTIKAAYGNNVKKGGALTYLPTNGLIYGLRGDRQKTFKSWTENAWTARANTSDTVDEGGALTSLNGLVYAFLGNSTRFRSYNPGTNSWTALANTPANVKKGGALTTDGTNIYALQGGGARGFWRYNVGSNTWTPLAATPAAVGWGGSLTYVAPYIYATRGNATNAFWRYNIATNTWTALANTPAVVADGGALTNDGTYIYALQGKTNAFWRYDRATNTWTPRANAPGVVAQGGALTFIPVTATVSRLTTMAAYPTLVTGGGKITVKITLTSADPVNNILPGALSTTPTGGASCATLTGPALASADDDISGPGDPVVYTWECTTAAGANPGSLRFSASATGDGPTTFATATSNSVLVTPILTFSANVTNPLNPPGLPLVQNTAIIDDSSDPTPRPPMCYAIASSKTGGTDDNDILVAWNQVSNAISDVGSGTGTTRAQSAAFNPEGTRIYTTDRDAIAGAGSDRFGYIDDGTGLYTGIGRLVSDSNPLEGVLGNFPVLNVVGMSFDPISGKLYAVHRREDATVGNTLLDVLFQIDPITGLHVEDAYGIGVDYVVLRTDLLPGGALYDVDAIAFHPSTGVLYAVANDSTTGFGDRDRLIRINPNSGVLTDIGRITNSANGAGINGMEGLDFQADGTLYGTTGAETATPDRLWRINLTTAVATLIAPFPSHTDYEAIACLPGGAVDVPIPPTPSNTTQTALTATIGDFVWADLDGQGDQDAGEPGLAGVKVFVDSNNNGIWDAGEPYDITDGYGHYRIFGLAAGTYTVRTDPATYPAGYSPSTPTSLSVNLSSGQQYNDADFGLQPPGTGSIGDMVWLDANGDGVFDPDGADDIPGTLDDEAGLEGVTVRLYRDLNNNGQYDPAVDLYVATDTTDANGLYLFTGLPAGNYLVLVDASSQIASPFGGTYTLASATTPTYDEDSGTTNPDGITAVALGSGASHLTADFGYRWNGTIGDYVWWDDNRNGTPDGGELPIAGAAVLLYFDANGNGILDPAEGDYQIGFTMTDANGLYHFNNLPPGPYLVDVYEDSITTDGVRNIVPTTANVIYKNLGPAETYLAADFGYFRGARVEGNVFWDEDRNGLFDGDETGLTPVTVTLTGTDMFGNPVSATVDTDPDGHFVFIVPEGDYTLTYDMADVLAIDPSLGDQTTPAAYTFHAFPGENWYENTHFDFGVDNSGAIGDLVWNDANGDGLSAGEPGLPGVTVDLYDSTGKIWLATTATDANGIYHFYGLPDGTYVVQVNPATLPAGYTQTYDNSGPLDHTGSATISGGNTVNTVDFGYQGPGGTYTVSGRVYDSSDNSALPGVEVCLYDSSGTTLIACLTTSPNGTYAFPGVPNGTYVIKVDPTTLPSSAYQPTYDPDGIGTPNETVVTVNNSNVVNQNFGYDQVYSSIRGTVCVGQEPGDGQCDPGQPPVPDVLVTLHYFGPDGIPGTADDATFTTTTDSNGDYAFLNLGPGIYQITKTDPPDQSALADADGGNPNNITVILAVGQDVVDQDFEVAAQTGVGDFVWWDVDGDGIQDAGEPGIPGVTVDLYTGACPTPPSLPAGPPLQTTVTDGTGFYRFTGLDAGSYCVVINAAEFGTGGTLEFWSATLQDQGADDTIDSDGDLVTHAATAVVSLGQVNDTVDFGFIITTAYTVAKDLAPGQANPARPGEKIQFKITITNTGSTWLTTLPLEDTYNSAFLTYGYGGEFAVPDSNDHVNDGVLNWSDLTAAPPYGFGADLGPGQSFEIIVTFTAREDTGSIGTLNIAKVVGVAVDPDGPAGPIPPAVPPQTPQTDDAKIIIYRPTGDEIAGFQAVARADGVRVTWETASEARILGFNVLRQAAGSPPVQANPELIFAEYGGASRGAAYQYQDGGLPAGRYTYLLQIVRLDGTSETYGTVAVVTTSGGG